MVNSTDFIERLEYLLDHYQISASHFADKIGVQRSSISHLLSARNKPSLEFVLKVVKKFPEVNLYWLLNGKGTFPSEDSNGTIPTSESVEDNAGSSAGDIERIHDTPTPSDTSSAPVQKNSAPIKDDGSTAPQNRADVNPQNENSQIANPQNAHPSSTKKDIDSIVIFYKDGSFKTYSEK